MKEISLSIIRKLQKNGYQAYWVGGCVRDILMGKTPNDYDIVTSARPEEIERLLNEFNIIKVGKKFGIILAEKNKKHFEIATFRSEIRYTDARHPDKVFWTSAKNDAERRDFTINGLFLDPLAKSKIEIWKFPGVRQIKSTLYGLVIDYVGGIKDLNDKIIRFIGNPNQRIEEDHLRLLRAIRFKNSLGFRFNSETFNAIKDNANKIITISKERLREELNKMFANEYRYNALLDLDKSGLLKYILPEITRLKGVPQPDMFHKEGDVFTHTLLSLKSLPRNAPITLVWAVLLHDTGKPDTITLPKNKNDRIRFNKHVKYSAGIASRVLRRLKFPNIERRLIVWLVKNHMIIGDIPKMSVAKQRRWLMDKRFPWLLKLNKADSLGAYPIRLTLYKKDLKLYNEVKKMFEEEKKKPKFKPFLTGFDVMRELQIDQGPIVGKLLKASENAQLEGKIKNVNQAKEFIKKIYKGQIK